MAEITIASYNKAVSPAFTGATATLKIWYDRQFLTSDDEIVLAGSVEYPNLEVACTVSGGGFTVTIPQFVIDSTIDGIPPNSRATAILFDADGIHRETVLANFRIPDVPTSTTWPALFIYNQGGLVTLPEEFYNKNEVNALLGTVTAAGGGTNTLGMSNLGNTSGTTGVISGASLQYLFAGGNNITLSQSLNGVSGTVTISAFNQTNQSLGLYAVSNTTQSSSGTVDARTLSFQGAGGVSVGVSNGSVIISAPVGGGAGGTNTLGMSNIGNTSGDTSIRTGSAIQLVFAGGNNVTLSQSTNGSSATVTISAFNQSVQPIGTASIGMSNLGNTSGTTGMVSDTSPRFVFAGGNNVTLSQSLNGASGTITISAFNQTVESHTFGVSNLGNTSGDTGAIESASVNAIFAGGNNVTLSVSKNIGQNQQTITISAANQSVQPIGTNTIGMSNIGNTAGDTAIRSGTGMQVVFAGGNNITLSQSTNGSSATITVSAFNQTNQTLGLYAVSNTTQSTSGTVDARTLSFQGAGVASVGISNGSVIVSVPAGGGAAGTNTLGMSNIGNTSGDTSIRTGSAIQLVFAGGNNVTLSQSTNGSSATVTISAFNQSVQAIGTHTLGMSNIGNTSGDTSIRTGTGMQIVFAGGNNVTLSQSTNGSSATVTISAFNQSVQPIGTNTIGMSNIGNTSGDTSIRNATGLQIVFAGGNNVTLSQSTNGSSATITVSAFNQTVESQSFGISNLGNTSGTSGIASGGEVRYLLAGGNNITLSQSLNGASGTVTISAAAQTVQPIGTNTLGMSNIGNTSGDTSIRTGTGMQIVWAGGNNITLSQSTNGSSATITVSAFNQTNQTLGLYAVSNTTQSSSGTVDARTLSFQGAGIASVGVSNGSVVISVPTGAPSPVNFSAGTTSNNLGSVVFSNSNGVSFGLNGSTITASAAGGGIALANSQTTYTSGTAQLVDGFGAITIASTTGQKFNVSVPQTSSLSAVGNLTITPNASTLSFSVGRTTYSSSGFGKQHVWAQSSSSLGQNSVYIYPEVVDNYLAGSVIKVPVMLTASSSAAAAQTRGYTMNFGVYTRHSTNSTVLSQHYSTSYTASMSQNSNGTFNIGIITGVGNSTSYNTLSASSAGIGLSASIHGARELILPWATTLVPGEYWFALRQSSSSAGVAGAGWNISHIIGSSSTQNQMGVSINSTNNGIAKQIGFGVYSATSSALPGGISMTQINQSALAVPIFFMSQTN